MQEDMSNAKIAEIVSAKSAIKQDVYEVTQACFVSLKKEAEKILTALSKLVLVKDSRVRIMFEDISFSEFHLHIGSDVLVFLMHSNVFDFEPSNPLKSSSYVKGDATRSYCGMLYVYNFLYDSFQYHRGNDVGYLIARLFINKDTHFFVQGKGQISSKFNDFINSTFEAENARAFLYELMAFVVDFDLYVPPIESVSEVTVEQINAFSQTQKMSTGKRLGYKYGAEE